MDNGISVRASSKTVTMRNGGAVYYSNYLNTRTRVSESYLNKSETNRIIGGNELTKGFRDAIISALIGMGSGAAGFIYSIVALANSNTRSQIKKAGYATVFHSDDGKGSATVLLPWKTYPKVTVYSGGKYKAR